MISVLNVIFLHCGFLGFLPTKVVPGGHDGVDSHFPVAWLRLVPEGHVVVGFVSHIPVVWLGVVPDGHDEVGAVLHFPVAWLRSPITHTVAEFDSHFGGVAWLRLVPEGHVVVGFVSHFPVASLKLVVPGGQARGFLSHLSVATLKAPSITGKSIHTYAIVQCIAKWTAYERIVSYFTPILRRIIEASLKTSWWVFTFLCGLVIGFS